jgi:peptide/nickel transport system permease protein
MSSHTDAVPASTAKGPDRLRFLWWDLEDVRVPRALRAILRSRTVLLGMVFVFLALFVAVAAPVISPYDPYKQATGMRLKPPVWEQGARAGHVLGTDALGRDVLSRMIYGARVSLIVAGVAVFIAGVTGVMIGLIAGFYGGWIDSALMGLTNFFLSFPYVLLAIAIMGIVGPGFTTLILVLGLTSWPIYTRIVRSEVLTLKEVSFVEAARALGVRQIAVLFKHIAPNVMNSVLVTASLETARMIINEAFFSFLGLGVQPPMPSWGNMLYDGKAYIFLNHWLITLPGIAIFVTTLGLNLIGDWLRDVLDPYMVF